ncbi:MAG: RsmD family RNA methyltransferase [Bacteroidetes bacterium]|nr:RsmD family RNA methyltransferase [Bacteroidota bacterium]
MRIINGIYRGKTIHVPKGLPLRPTTDFAKEGLFNILNNKVDYGSIAFLDLFSGTGHISLEMGSRGCENLTAVDKNGKCVGFLRSISKELSLNVNTIKSDVFDFLKNSKASYDLIFADPPYDLETIPLINELVFNNKLLKEDGILIIEHGPKTHLEGCLNFTQQRKYGNVNFSFFENRTLK